MAVTRCPHCQAPLPEPEESGAFCTSCGRRVAGWKKAPQRAGDSAPLVDGNAVTRRAEASDVEAALAAAARRSSAERRAAEQAEGEGDEEEADEGGLIDPAATVKLEPASASKVTDQRPSAPGDDASVSAELAAVRSGMPTPKMLRALGLALAVGSVAAGGVFFLVRVLQKPAPSRPPVVVNLEEPTPPLPVDPSDPVTPRRRRGKRGAVPPATTASASVPSKPAPASAPPATTPAPVTTAPSANPPPARNDPPATKTEPAKTTPAPPPTQFIPTDTDEQVPPTEEELADEAKAAQFAEGIRFVARRYRNQIEACYERAFKQEASSPGGRIDISFTVNKEGRAKKIATIGNTTGKEQVSKCIEQLIGEWQFPRPPSGEFNTAYPFVFSGG